MTHLPFIVAAYAVAVLIPAGYAVAAVSRLRSAQRRLAGLDARRRGPQQQVAGVGRRGRAQP